MEVLSEIQNTDLMKQTRVRVELECVSKTVLPGSEVCAKVTVFADCEAVKASGVFIDLLDSEEFIFHHISPIFTAPPPALTHCPVNETFRIASSFELETNKSKTFEGRFRLPVNFQPTFTGRFSKHEWQIRARVETSRGDAESGFQLFKIGAGF